MSYFPPYIDASGIHLPSYEDRLQDLLSAYRSIFGMEAELSPEVPDYQLLSVLAKALDDTSALVLAAFASRNPSLASGAALDLLLPQAGLTRLPGETDAQARERMRLTLGGQGAFSLDAMEAAIRQVNLVSHVLIRVNNGDETVDGISPHSVMAVVLNGSASKIAEAIFRKKPPGIGTCGTTVKNVSDGRGSTVPIRFSRPTQLGIQIRIALKTYDGFDADAVKAAVTAALLTYVNTTMDIGEALTIPQLYGLIYQAAGSYASTFAVTDLSVSGAHGIEREKLIPAWNEKYSVYGSEYVVYEIS